LQPYFDEDDEEWAGDGSKTAVSSSSGVEFQPFTEYKRGLKRSAKEIDEEHGFSLTAMSPKKEEESSSSEPSSVTSRGSDSEESDRYSPTNPRQNRHHRFFGSPTEGVSRALAEKGESSSSSPRNESPSPPRSSAKDKKGKILEGKSPAILRNVPVHDWGTPGEPNKWPS
jgi:hypothetical protein